MQESVFSKALALSGRLRYFTFLAGLLVAVLVVCQLPVSAQNATGSLSGVVTDSSNAVVPDAKVVLKNEATETLRDTVSNGSGFFSFQAVPPASYTLTVSAPGFTTWEERGIPFTQGASVTIPNIVLQVGGTKSEVAVVAANDVVVPTDTGQTSTTLNTHMITQISLAGRDAAELIKIMPGMGSTNGLSNKAPFDPTTGTANNTGPIGAYSANGQQPNGSMTMTSDGANLLDPGNQGTQTANINADQTAEVTMLTNAYGAEFAKGPATFQAIGKSGGAQFHGQGYFYARNGIFNSEDSYLKSQGVTKPEDHYYYPGGDFGGPVLLPFTKFNHNRDKLFFYAAYEKMWQQQAGYLNSYFIPTSQMMAGNFSPAYLKSLGPNVAANWGGSYEAAPGGNAGASNFPGGMIPQSMLDPNSAVLYKTMPQPNVDPTANSQGANFQYLVAPPQNRWELRLRGDYNISDNTKLFFSWNRQDEADENLISVWWNIGGALPYPSSMPANQQSNVYSANLTHVFSPTLTNEFVYAEAKFMNPINLSDPSAVDPSKLGFSLKGFFPTGSAAGYAQQIPNLFSWEGMAGYSAYTFGDKGFPAGFGKYSNTPNISDNISKVWGTHTLKAGFYWDFARNQQTSGPGEQFTVQGTADFENWGAQSTGNILADFVTGRVTNFYQANGGPTDDEKYYQYSFYVQDSWKVSRRLTVTYGLRFEHMGNWFTASGPGLAVWDPAVYAADVAADAPYPGERTHATDSAIPVSGLPSKPFFMEPRVGAAYDLFGNGKTVLRGGFGEYRYQIAYNSTSGDALNDPLGYESLSSTWGCCVGWESFNQYNPGTSVAGYGAAPSGVMMMGDERTPHSYTYNFTVSQRVPWNSVAEFQYSGNESKDLMLHGPLSNVDQIPVGAFFGPDPKTGVVNNPNSSSFPTNDYYPIAAYTGMTLISHGSYSNYNAFIATWQKQTGRITFTANYTFSKALGIRDNETDNGAGQGPTMDPFNLAANYGVLSFDHTNIFNAAYVINLPSPIHGNPFLGGVVNGWELSGITQYSSGAPIQTATGGDLNATYPGTFEGLNYGQQVFEGTTAYQNAGMYPVLICDPRKNLASNQYYNPACFAPETTVGQQGTFIWPYLKGPAFFDSDLSLYKNFQFKEHQNVQFRFQTYNFLNHPNPDMSVNGLDLKLNFNNSGVMSMTNVNPLAGYAANTVGRRVVMMSVKYSF
jgi:hypothetical protein